MQLKLEYAVDMDISLNEQVSDRVVSNPDDQASSPAELSFSPMCCWKPDEIGRHGKHLAIMRYARANKTD